FVASIALLPALAGCSSSSPTDYAANGYPSQSLADLLKGSLDSPPPARAADPLAPPSSSTAATAAPAPASSAPTDGSDPAAAGYPSVSLIDLLTGSTKPAPH